MAGMMLGQWTGRTVAQGIFGNSGTAGMIGTMAGSLLGAQGLGNLGRGLSSILSEARIEAINNAMKNAL